MLRAAAVLATSAVVLAQQQPDQKASPELTVALARTVNLPTTAERQAAVDGLLKKSADLDEWLSVCREFGDFEQLPAGPMEQTLALSVLGNIEETDLHLFVPKSYDPNKPAPLLLWGHGSGGGGAPQLRLWQQVAEQVGMLVLAPTEPIANGYSKQRRERESTLQALRWARRIANIDENAIFVGGWSRGGHLAWDLALRHPDLFAGMLPCVGGPMMELGKANNLRYLENIAHLPIRDLQGSGDDPRLLMNLRLAFQQLKKLRAKDAQFVEFADRGHDADLSAVDWPEFFAKRRQPRPKQVVRIAADPLETRSSWVEIVGMRRQVQVEAQPQVAQRQWQRMNELQKRAYLLKALARNTARLKVTQKGKGRFVADGSGVTKFALLLGREQLGKGNKVEVRLRNKPTRKVAVPSARVLLEDFVERFDRTRLPVARVVVP